MSLILLLVFLVAAFTLWWALRRGTELFVLDVQNGKVQLRRGAIPPRLLSEMADVLGRPPVRQGRVVAEVEDQAPKLKASGDIDGGRLQRLRNVVGGYPVAKIRNGTVRR